MRSAPITRLLASGFIAAAVATVLCSSISPQHPVSTAGVVARAIAYAATVFGAGGIAAYLMLVVGENDRAVRSHEITLSIASTAMWLPPLLMFYGQNSWFAPVLFTAFAVEVARLISFLRATLRSTASAPAEAHIEAHPFSVLKKDFPFGTSMLAAFMLQGAIFASVDGRTILAGAFYLVGTIAIAYRSFQMFCDSDKAGIGDLAHRTWTALLFATLLIVFAWLPYIAVGNAGSSANMLPGKGGTYLEARKSELGNGNRQHQGKSASSVSDWLLSLLLPKDSHSPGDSFEVAKRLLESSPPNGRQGANAQSSKGNTNIRIAEPVTGPIFPAVELYPDRHNVTKLVAPPAVPRSGRSSGNSDPFSIPFDGVYWFWRGPSDQPPANSVVLHGSPSAHFFRSTDGDLMSMEARQNLGFAVDPRRYSAIEVEIENADPFPNSVSLVLKVRNTAATGKSSQNLGLERVPNVRSATESSHQTLRFHIPSRLTMRSFDELTVSYFLKGARGNRSARIAIERFRFVPRGG